VPYPHALLQTLDDPDAEPFGNLSTHTEDAVLVENCPRAVQRREPSLSQAGRTDRPGPLGAHSPQVGLTTAAALRSLAAVHRGAPLRQPPTGAAELTRRPAGPLSNTRSACRRIADPRP